MSTLAKPQFAELRVTLRTPFISKSSTTPHHGLDAVLARSADGQHLVLPGTLLAGRLRHLARAVVASLGEGDADAQAVLGLLAALGTQAEGDQLSPNTGVLDFTDLRCPLPDQPTAAVRIEIDADKGAARHGALLLLEQAAASGHDIGFEGRVKLHVSPTDAVALCKTLEALIPLIDSIGALQGVGYGRIVNATVGAPQAYQPAVTLRAPEACHHLRLTLALDEPFCFAALRAGDNLFKSVDHIPGAAIKGALASAWLRLRQSNARSIAAAGPAFDPERQALAQAFDAMTVTAARRCNAQGARSSVLPLSLAQVGKQWFDLALLGAPALVHGQAPAFAPDWKGSPDDACLARYGTAQAFAREWRVRTAIDEATRRAADSQLFAYEMCCPAPDDRLQCTVYFADDESGKRAAQQLADLLTAMGGVLPGLGKTKATASLCAIDACPVVPKPDLDQTPWLLTLQSPALIIAPQDYAGAREVQAAYRQAFATLSGQTLTLAHSYTQHEGAGGHYLHRRFQGREKAYQPWLLTSAGSVFALMAEPGHEAQAQATLRDWLLHGLPLPTWLAATDFAHCPYRPQEGYGELQLDSLPQRQAAVRPDDKRITLLTDWEA